MKKLAVELINSKFIFFLITSLIILGLNLTPAIAQFRHTPAGRNFAFIHNNTQDFFFYQSLMNEGANGAFLTTNPYTTEPHKPSIIFAFFLWLGKLSKLFDLSYALTYHLVRIILSILFLSSIFYLLSYISIPYPRLAFLFFLFAAPFMHTINDGGKLTAVPYMNWWTGMDPVRRIAYLPHHMFGGLFLVITIILIIKYINTKRIKYIIWSSLLTLPLAFIHPPSLFIILIILPPTIIIYLFTSAKTRISKSEIRNNVQNINVQNSKLIGFGHLKFVHLNLFRIFVLRFLNFKFIGLAGFWVIGLLVLIFMVSQTNQGFPWSQYISWESKLQFPLDKELIGALGILFPFAFLGAIKAIASKRFSYILIACWLFVPLLLIPFAAYLNISNIRLIQGVPYLPIAILAVLGIEVILQPMGVQHTRGVVSRLYREKLNRYSKLFGARNFKFIGSFVYLFICLLFIIFTLPTIQWSLKDQIREYWPIYGNVYLDNRLNKAFSFINNNFPAQTVTLSTFYTGNYLPFATHTRSFIGHFGYTYNIEEKQKKVQKFFEHKMSSQEAKEFIVSSKIDLVFQGPEEKPIYNNYLYPTILKPVYETEEVTLYVLK